MPRKTKKEVEAAPKQERVYRGKQKIDPTKYIENPERRSNAFSKRKASMIRNAGVLRTLTGAEYVIGVFKSNHLTISTSPGFSFLGSERMTQVMRTRLIDYATKQKELQRQYENEMSDDDDMLDQDGDDEQQQVSSTPKARKQVLRSRSKKKAPTKTIGKKRTRSQVKQEEDDGDEQPAGPLFPELNAEGEDSALTGFGQRKKRRRTSLEEDDDSDSE